MLGDDLYIRQYKQVSFEVSKKLNQLREGRAIAELLLLNTCTLHFTKLCLKPEEGVPVTYTLNIVLMNKYVFILLLAKVEQKYVRVMVISEINSVMRVHIVVKSIDTLGGKRVLGRAGSQFCLSHFEFVFYWVGRNKAFWTKVYKLFQGMNKRMGEMCQISQLGLELKRSPEAVFYNQHDGIQVI